MLGAIATLGRLSLYLREMYPPGQRLVMALVLFFGPYFALKAAALPNQPIEITKAGLAGAATYFLFLLGLRISDEFKDYELDCRLFPERPLPSGRVHAKDLKLLFAASLLGILALNTLMAPFTLGFCIIMFYGFLMLKFFFIKARIQKSLILALITHNPIAFLLTVYTSFLAAQETGAPPLSLTFLHIGILFMLPGLIWELSRKIRAPQDENEYETYSQVFGYKWAALNPALLYVVHFVLTLNLASTVPISVWYLSFLGILALVAVWFSVRFIMNPNSVTAQLKRPAELYSTVACLGFVIDLILAKGLAWRL